MGIWNVAMLYSTSVTLEVECTTYDEAIERAKEMVEEFKSDYIDLHDVEFDEVIYASRIGGK